MLTIRTPKIHAIEYINSTDLDIRYFKSEMDQLVNELLKDMNSKQNVNLNIVDDEEMQKLNITFRNKDMPTNVLAFPNIGIGADDELGDIAINTDAVTRESNQQNMTTRDRFLHLLAHGTLHLFGFDHKENNEAEAMEELEIKYLKDFNIKNPYTYEI